MNRYWLNALNEEKKAINAAKKQRIVNIDAHPLSADVNQLAADLIKKHGAVLFHKQAERQRQRLTSICS